MKTTAPFALAIASVMCFAAAPASAFDLGVYANTTGVFEQADVCTYNEAMWTVRRSEYPRVVAELPQGPGAPWRFISFSPGPQEFIGLSLDASSCAMTVVADITLKRPWCEYYPVAAQRCPTVFIMAR